MDGRKIYRADVEKYYQNQTAGSDQVPVGEQATSLRLSILKELIDNEILMRRAEKLGLLATDEEVDSKLNEIKSPYTKEQFEARLKEKKITVDDFKRDLRRSLTVDKVLNKEITSKINVTDQDITNYYNAHKAEFNLIEPQYHLARILVTTSPNPQVHNLKNDKAQNEADARKKIQMIVNRLDSGDDFGTLAMNYSEDAETSGSGGDLGFAPESSLRNTDPGTRDAVTKLKPGQYSAVIPLANPMNKQVAAIPDCEADFEGTGGTARVGRSAGAASHPLTAARPARTIAQSCVLRGPARSGPGGELLRAKSAGRQRQRAVGRCGRGRLSPRCDGGRAPLPSRAKLLHDRQHIPGIHRRALSDGQLQNDTLLRRLDFVLHLHRFDHHHTLSGFHRRVLGQPGTGPLYPAWEPPGAAALCPSRPGACGCATIAGQTLQPCRSHRRPRFASLDPSRSRRIWYALPAIRSDSTSGCAATASIWTSRPSRRQRQLPDSRSRSTSSRKSGSIDGDVVDHCEILMEDGRPAHPPRQGLVTTSGLRFVLLFSNWMLQGRVPLFAVT